MHKLEAAQSSDLGQLMRRALDIRALMKAGLHLTPADIEADEMYALLTLEDEERRYRDEKAKSDGR